MTNFVALQQNQLVSYKPSTENVITNPINLSSKEIKIFEIIKEVIKEINLQNVELWVVGGWIRDHLINIPSDDIDIIIKGINSKMFVKLLNEKVNKTKYIIVNNKIKKLDGNEINLTKTTIFDIMIDFIEINGSLIEDAKKRDFTFNALYYNILENKIEDVLNMGINDLKNGYIRTCISPNQLFSYDSLNILRMFRFATKYQFVIDDECLIDIEKNKKVYQSNLLNTISKERIHKEMNLIFTTLNPSFAIYSFYKFDLLENVLHLDLHKNKNKWFTEKDIVNIVNLFIIGKICFDKYKKYFEGEDFDDKYKRLYYSILLTIIMRNFTDNNKNNVSKIILAKVLRLDSKNILKIISHFDEYNNFISKNEYNRLNVGILLRKILVCNISKMTLISVSNEYVMKANSNIILDKVDDNELDNIFNKYFELIKFIKKENLQDVNEIKSILDGKEIQKCFPGIHNKYLGLMLEILVNKQIETNNNLSKDEAIKIITSKIQELNIQLNTKNNQ